MGAVVGEEVYCTLCLSDSYLPGAAVLAKSLRDGGTTRKLACLIVATNLRHSVVKELQSLYNYVITVDAIGNPHPANLYLMGRPDLQYTFTKLHLWNLTQFRKVVYIDADVVALRAPDELFDLPDPFAAAPDVGWPDAFNTGVMVLSPDANEYATLRNMASAGESFDGADQGLLNQYYQHRPWKRLSFTYNCTPSGFYQYEPAFRYYKSDVSMVHFIGAEKPWRRGRSAGGTPDSFQELLDKWWAVYDRHFKFSTTDLIYGERERSQVIQEGVQEHGQKQDPAYYATGYPTDYTSLPKDEPLTEPRDVAEGLDQGHIEPPKTGEARQFAAPYMEWDATRAAPPPQSKPEAASLAVQNYEFNNDPQPFRPPASYPEPPKGMWFDVPKTAPRKEEKLAPIFPWEQHDRPAPTRKFVDDVPDVPEPRSESNFGADEFEVHMDETIEPKTPAIKLNDETPWVAFGTANKNAWDEVSGIENYVRALTAHQRNRGKAQVFHQAASPSEGPSADVAAALAAASASGPADIDPAQLVEQVQKRRESLILTDFPTAVERPSLPVTPAPVRRAVFWGGERDEEGESGSASTVNMPPAEGVPHQADWNPTVQLDQLRRNSLLVGPEDLRLPPGRTLPSRDLPESLSSIAAASGAGAAILASEGSTPTGPVPAGLGVLGRSSAVASSTDESSHAQSALKTSASSSSKTSEPRSTGSVPGYDGANDSFPGAGQARGLFRSAGGVSFAEPTYGSALQTPSTRTASSNEYEASGSRSTTIEGYAEGVKREGFAGLEQGQQMETLRGFETGTSSGTISSSTFTERTQQQGTTTSSLTATGYEGTAASAEEEDQSSQYSDFEELERREFEKREQAEAEALAARDLVDAEDEARRGSGMFRSWRMDSV